MSMYHSVFLSEAKGVNTVGECEKDDNKLSSEFWPSSQ